MIGAISPAYIPAAPRPDRYYAVACCARCGNVPGSANARQCRDAACQVSDRLAHAKGMNDADA